MLVISDKGILNKTQDVRLHPVAKRLEIINVTDKQASFSTSDDGITWDSPITVNALSKLEYSDKTSYLRLIDGDYIVIVNPLVNEIDVVNSDETITTSVNYLESSINTLGQRITTLESKPVLTETKVSELINTAVGSLPVPLSSTDIQDMIDTSIGNIPDGLTEQNVQELISGATSNLVSNSALEDKLADYLDSGQIDTKINSAIANKADTDTVATIQSDLTNLIN